MGRLLECSSAPRGYLCRNSTAWTAHPTRNSCGHGSDGCTPSRRPRIIASTTTNPQLTTIALCATHLAAMTPRPVSLSDGGLCLSFGTVARAEPPQCLQDPTWGQCLSGPHDTVVSITSNTASAPVRTDGQAKRCGLSLFLQRRPTRLELEAVWRRQ